MVSSGKGRGGEPEPGWACGSRMLWTGVTCSALVLGLVLMIVPIMIGGCSCSGECVHGNTNSCSEAFGGCTRPPYDEEKCKQLVVDNILRGGPPPCDDPTCTFTGGMDVGAVWGMILAGVAMLVVCCVVSCGICPCACFQGSKSSAVHAGVASPVPFQPAAPVVGMAVHPGNAPPPPPPGGPPVK